MSSSTSPTELLLSEYERTRAVNIERNNARLVALGLITAAEEQRSNDLAWKRRRTTTTKESSCKQKGQDKEAKKKRKRKEVPTEPARKSLRVQGKTPEGLERLDNDDNTNDTTTTTTVQESIRQRQSQVVQECRQARALAALRYAQDSDAAQRAGRENPTATYQHCLTRVRTMTDRALMNRIRAIERAVGKHAVVKMAIFKSCLQDHGLWDLADAAAAALERLKALTPPVE